MVEETKQTTIINTMAGQAGRPTFFDQTDMNASARDPFGKAPVKGRSYQIDQGPPVDPNRKAGGGSMTISSKDEPDATGAIPNNNLPSSAGPLVDAQNTGIQRPEQQVV